VCSFFSSAYIIKSFSPVRWLLLYVHIHIYDSSAPSVRASSARGRNPLIQSARNEKNQIEKKIKTEPKTIKISSKFLRVKTFSLSKFDPATSGKPCRKIKNTQPCDRVGYFLFLRNLSSTHSSYSEGDHCPLRLTGLPAAHTFF